MPGHVAGPGGVHNVHSNELQAAKANQARCGHTISHCKKTAAGTDDQEALRHLLPNI
jgi:hypothetical protein